MTPFLAALFFLWYAAQHAGERFLGSPLIGSFLTRVHMRFSNHVGRSSAALLNLNSTGRRTSAGLLNLSSRVVSAVAPFFTF